MFRIPELGAGLSCLSQPMIENYTKLCTITVDLSHLPLQARPKATGRGTFFRLDYEIVLLFGLTELKAQVTWKEKVCVDSSVTAQGYP